MTQNTTLQIAKRLPAGALLGPERDALLAALVGQGASWFTALPNSVETESEGKKSWVTGWSSITSEANAIPTRPNDRGGRFDPEGSNPAMCFRAGQHCGYSVDGIAPTAEQFTVAVIYQSEDQDGRTLFSVAGADKSNMLFANESSGALAVLDREGSLRLKCDAPPIGSRYGLLVVSYESGKLRVSVNGGPPEETNGKVPGLEGAAELFIGCRNHRSGLAKTLGTSRISDVYFWPEMALQRPADMPLDPVLTMLEDFWRWNR